MPGPAWMHAVVVAACLCCLSMLSLQGAVFAGPVDGAHRVQSTGDALQAPRLPRQFRAQVHITSHLTDPSQSYPPSERVIDVYYDYDARVARADMVSGFETNKTYIRRYDEKKEYMVKYGRFSKCERAYLGEEMPEPAVPFAQAYVGLEKIRGVLCEHWMHKYANVRVHIYVDKSTRAPIRLTEENYVEGVPTMLMTYELQNVKLGPQPSSLFELPRGYSHKSCERMVGGFPYIHVFHYYLRF